MSNIVVQKRGGYLSYLGLNNRSLLNKVIDAALGIPTVEETAFVIEGEDHMAILEGDWREACEGLDTIEDCMEVFWSNVEKATHSSQHDYMGRKVR